MIQGYKNIVLVAFFALPLFSIAVDMQSESNQAFPAKIPLEKPADRKLSAAMERMYDVWNPYEDRGNEFFSNFKYSRLEGFTRDPNVSRRDPSKIIEANGKYYVYYTCRRTNSPPSGSQKATDEIPSKDWDLAEIWYAESIDGFRWQEKGPAVKRPAKGQFGWRSNCTPDILVWKGKYYLYYQAYSDMIHGGDVCPVTVAVAESPDGPFRPLGKPIVEPGGPDDWDCACIHDPFPIIYKGKVYLYYKGSPGQKRGGDNLIRAQGVAIADDPMGSFRKSPLNPVLNSGHEVCVWPYKEGVAAMVSLDGPEKNTIQYALDGVNFEVKALLQVPPIAPGPFIPDAFDDTGDGRGITWGLCHINPDGGGAMNASILARFDCDLSRDEDVPLFKRNNLRFDEQTYFQRTLKLPEPVRKQREKTAKSKENTKKQEKIPYWLSDYAELYKEDPRQAALKWFKEAKFGMFVHLALASLCENGKADYVSWREGFASDRLLKYVGVTRAQYESIKNKDHLLFDRYLLPEFDANKICQLATDAQMKYINFTTLHLGRCHNFNTKASDFNSVNAPCQRDLVAEMAAACQKYGLALFLYVPPEYSQDNPVKRRQYLDVIRELLTNYGSIAGIWFDGIGYYYSNPGNYTKLKDTFNYIRSIQPHCLVSFKEGAVCEEDFISPEHFMLPFEYQWDTDGRAQQWQMRKNRWDNQNAGRWETCNQFKLREVNTVMQECFNRDAVHVKSGWINDESARHLSGEEVYDWLTYARFTSSNLLMNIGPRADGSIHPDDIKALREVGQIISNKGWAKLSNCVEITN